jgi:hypothetical protein
MEFVRISLPSDLAAELVNDCVAVHPYETRGIADEVIHMVIDGINVTASVVTVAMAADAVRKFATRLWVRSRKSEEDVMRVTVMVPGDAAPHELEVKRDDDSGADKILDLLIEVLPAS